MIKEQIFDNIIAEFKSLKSTKTDSIIMTHNYFEMIVADLKEYKNIVYQKRITDLKSSIVDHPHIVRRSTFELMEHNFRENSHSNVLQYIFEHSNLGENSVRILQSLIQTQNSEIANYISTNLSKKKYEVFREYSTEKGRIDLLISDSTYKFNIVVENKILSEISVKEMNEKKEITKTQLDYYYDFITNKFKGYKNLFFLLSYYVYNDEINNYDKMNYESVYNAIKDLKSEDTVLSEYKSLLISLITGINKEEINSALQKLNANEAIQLNSIEKLNKIISYEIRQN